MPGALINTTLKAINQGVSQQFQEGRFDSQVTEMKNCLPNLARGVLRRNPTRAVDVLTSPNMPLKMTDAFVYSYDRGTSNEQYIVVIPGDGTISVFNANGTYLYSEYKQDYLTISPLYKAREQFEALTIGDHTFIINKTITTKFDETFIAPSKGYYDYAFYWIKKTTGVITNQYQDTSGNSGTRLEGYTYTINDYSVQSIEDTRPGETNPDLGSSYKIADKIAENSTTSGMNLSSKGVAYNIDYGLDDIEWGDTFGNDASLGVWKTVGDSSELPAKLPSRLDGFIVQVTGSTSTDIDDYYLQYKHKENSWQEVPAPGVYTTLDSSTMPHVLYRLSTGFKFDTYQGVLIDGSGLDGESKWGTRQTRGMTDLDDPSFIGSPLTSIFFHKNRLGLLTRDSVILSSTNEFGNFFVSSALDVIDDDPIDLSIASTDVSILRSAVDLSGQLILFSDDTQYGLLSLKGALTPNTANIVPISSYTYDATPKAISVGNKVYFTTTIGDTSQIYSYKIVDDNTIVSDANNITLHLPSYITSPLKHMVGHDVLGYVFMTQESKPRELIVFNNVVKEGKDLQLAFHKWTFLKDILSIHIIKNDLYILFFDRDLVKISLDVPPLIENVEYRDYYNTIARGIPYKSVIVFSKFYIQDKSGLGTVRGRYQIRTIEYTINKASKYMTTIYSLDKVQLVSDEFYGPRWRDEDTWVDDLYWYDSVRFYTRDYYNDSKVTVMGNNENLTIEFRNNPDEPDEGFEIATVNVEGYFYQRSKR